MIKSSWSEISKYDGIEKLITNEEIITYERRKRSRSRSNSKSDVEIERSLFNSGHDLPDQEKWEQRDQAIVSIESTDPLLCSNDTHSCDGRELALENVFMSPDGGNGDFQDCIEDALSSTIKEACTHSDHFHTLVQNGRAPNGTHQGFDGTFSKPCLTQSCARVFLNVMISENFAALRKILSENFDGVKGNLFSVNLIFKRMKAGAYEESPQLFSQDLEELWVKIKELGSELVSLASSLSDASKECCKEQLGDLHTLARAEQESTPESVAPNREEEKETRNEQRLYTCKKCERDADPKDSLVCDSCGQMYHITCVSAVTEGTSSINWCCPACIATALGSHQNCVVCDRVHSAAVPEKDPAGSPENQEPHQEARSCKICGNDVRDGEKVTVCSHDYCANRVYHTRCLSKKQLEPCGTHWFCPSCLCRACLVNQNDAEIILCDGCDEGYHMYCVRPPLRSVPSGNWFCRNCDERLEKIKAVKIAYEEKERQEKKDQLENLALVENVWR